MLVKLSIASGILPMDLFIQGVSIGEDRDPWTSGGFADVFRGTFRGQQVAVKRLRIQNEDKKTVNPVCPFPLRRLQRPNVHKMICREALLWKYLQHPYILPFFGVDAETFSSRNALCLVSPWMHQGTLRQYITSSSYDDARERDRLVSPAAVVASFDVNGMFSCTRVHWA
jgi:serine/threonine protein kinase